MDFESVTWELPTSLTTQAANHTKSLKILSKNLSFENVFYKQFISSINVIGEGTLPWAIFHLRIFSNYFSQKFKEINITIWKSDHLTMYGNFCLDLYQYYYI